jgi:hypothetical protein
MAGIAMAEAKSLQRRKTTLCRIAELRLSPLLDEIAERQLQGGTKFKQGKIHKKG